MSSPIAANTVDAAALADELARFRVIDPDRLTALLTDFPGGGPVALAEYLVQNGILSPFQADRALAGESRVLVLGPYRLTDSAGTGTFGPVFAAHHRDKPGQFRVRVFPLRSLWRARQAKQLARSLGGVTHPTVVPLVDADSANGLHYLVWPQAEGAPLAERVAEEPLPPGEVVAVLAHLAEALHALHTRNLVHGALTPRIVLVDSRGPPRILDLGAGAVLAANLEDQESLLDTLSRSVAAAGIVPFAAPEFLATGRGTPAADQYALGAIGYYALTGEAPDTPSSLGDGHSQVLPLGAINPDLPEELTAVIDRMLQPRPEDRFAGLDEVHDRLAGIGVWTAARGESSPPESQPMADPSMFSVSAREVERSAVGPIWNPPQIDLDALPARDDSDASITFELPPPEMEHPSPEIGVSRLPPTGNPSAAATETPSQRLRETETYGREDAVRPRPEPVASSRPFGHRTETTLPPGPGPQFGLGAGSKGRLSPPPVRSGPDPRTGINAPIRYHTQLPGGPVGPPTGSGEPPLIDSVLWRKVKRNLLFWQTPQDKLRVSVYGPVSVTPGQSAKVSVYIHTAETAENVRTLSRAFHHDAELIGSGFAAQEVARDTQLAVHLSVTNAGISKSLQTLNWLGQPHRLVFDLHVPWESPGGPAPGLVSIGRENVRIGRIEFRLTLLPRKG